MRRLRRPSPGGAGTRPASPGDAPRRGPVSAPNAGGKPRVYIYIYIHTYIHTHTRIYVYTHIYIYMYILKGSCNLIEG